MESCSGPASLLKAAPARAPNDRTGGQVQWGCWTEDKLASVPICPGKPSHRHRSAQLLLAAPGRLENTHATKPWPTVRQAVSCCSGGHVGLRSVSLANSGLVSTHPGVPPNMRQVVSCCSGGHAGLRSASMSPAAAPGAHSQMQRAQFHQLLFSKQSAFPYRISSDHCLIPQH